uniref:Uncharacterized protein n=1 Tax=Arundo donax TaxID=35708 RepID=A0A0A9G6F2_ARUDO
MLPTWTTSPPRGPPPSSTSKR